MNRKLLEKPLAFVQRFRTQSADTGLPEKSGYLEQLRSEEVSSSKRNSSSPVRSGSTKDTDPSIWYVDTDTNSSLPVLSNLMSSNLTTESENHGRASSGVEKKAVLKTRPKSTIEYKVKLTDTLASIAAQFDTTPSELIKLNKLVMRTVFPSQVLFVPDGSTEMSEEENSSSSPPPLVSPQEKLKFDVPLVKMADKPPAKIPGHVERQTSLPSPPADPLPPQKLSEDEVEMIDKECHERFIKINVKHITDGQGVVSGTLLVTPNAVMFDPNVSDPLVIENGAEKYGMITPMDMVMSAAMYHDIAAMKLRGQKNDDGVTCKPMIYHAHDCPLFHHKHHHSDSPDHLHNELCTDLDSMRPSRSTTVDSLRSEVESMCSCGALSRDVSVHDSLGNLKSTDIALQKQSDVPSFEEESQKSLMRDPDCVSQAVDHLADFVSGLSVTDTSNKCDDINTSVPNPLDYDSLDSLHTDSITKSANTSDTQMSGINTSVPNPLDYDSLDSLHTDRITKSANTSDTQMSGNTANVDQTSENSVKSHDNDANISAETADLDNFKQISGQSSDVQGSTSNDRSTEADVRNEKVDSNPSDSKIVNISQFPIEKSRNDDLMVCRDDNKEKTSPRNLHVNTDIADDLPAAQFSPLKVSAQHLNNFVNYATGLFRNSSDDRLVKDVRDMKQDEVDSKSSQKMDKQYEVENAIKLEDKPSLFQTLDKIIPKPSAVCEDPPLYLCLRVGQPKFKEVSQTCPIESYRSNKKKPEYWFSIPREKVDQLYAFFVQWTPDIYGDEDDMDPEQRGFVVFDEEDLENESQLEIVDEHFASIQKIRKDWEIISKVEAIRRMSSVDIEENLPLPDLIGDTTILTYDEQIQQLSNSLPPRTIGYPWTLVYSSETHGFSLKTLYRSMQGLDSPILLVVEDSREHIFGAVVNCPLKISDHFYGTGESFLYTFYPEFKIFHWSGENNFFLKGNQESLAIGAGQGLFGLWFDGDLYHGRSQRCDTFDNDILTESEDFCVKGFEAWAFV